MLITKMTDLPLKGKRVLIREDFNVPMNEAQQITSTARIEAALPTIEYAHQHGATVILMSHLGRPVEGQQDESFSLRPVAEKLTTLLGKPVRLVKDWLNGFSMVPGEIILCENVRFLKGEKANDRELAKKMADLCDIFVMDAFGVAHRKQASTYGVAELAPIACAGPLLVAELEALSRALERPSHPVTAIVGGAKVSSKLGLLRTLASKADTVIVGGGIANTFLKAKGYAIGKSLYEAEWVHEAEQLLKAVGGVERFPLPIDVVVAKEFSANAPATIKSIEEIESDDLILDIGPKTGKNFAQIILASGTLIWNGPVGVFEFDAFSTGTQTLAQAIAESKAFSIAGGGDTIAAIEKFHISDRVSYISTGGGAFLEFLQGDQLPSVAILEQRGSL